MLDLIQTEALIGAALCAVAIVVIAVYDLINGNIKRKWR